MKNILICYLLLSSAFLKAYSQSWERIEKRILAGKEYLEKKGDAVNPQYELLKSFYQRKFGLNCSSVNEKLLQGSLIGFKRIYDKKAIMPERLFDELEHPLDKITFQALFCKQTLFNIKDYLNQIDTIWNKSSLEASHCLLAITWLQENGCCKPEELETSKRKISTYLQKVIAENNVDHNDQRFEAIAILQYSGFSNIIGPKEMKEIIDAQLPDGSWPINSRLKSGNDHTTAMAMWALLEFYSKKKSAEPFVVQ
jgi:hypothetical protein